METWIFMVNNGTTGTFNNEGKVIHDFIETATISNKERKFSKHPTQKPIGLYSPLLFLFFIVSIILPTKKSTHHFPHI